MHRLIRFPVAFGLIVALSVAGCAAPAPTATPTSPAVAAPTPTKAAPTATPTKRPLTKVVMAMAGYILGYGNMFIGIPKGFYQDEGLDVELVIAGSGTKVAAAVSSGSAQFGGAGIQDSIVAVHKGAPMKVIGVANTGTPVQVVMRKDVADRLGVSQKSPIAERGKALKGLTLAPMSEAGGTALIGQLMLSEGGLDPLKDAVMTAIGGDAESVAALRQGAVDVVIRGAPSSVVPIVEGYGVLLFNSGDEQLKGLTYAAGGIPGHKEFLDRSPDVTESFFKAIIRGAKLIKQDQPEAVKALRNMEFFKELDERVLQRAIDLNLGAILENPTVTRELFHGGVDFYNAARPPEEQVQPTFEQIVDNRYAEAAWRQLSR